MAVQPITQRSTHASINGIPIPLLDQLVEGQKGYERGENEEEERSFVTEIDGESQIHNVRREEDQSQSWLKPSFKRRRPRITQCEDFSSL